MLSLIVKFGLENAALKNDNTPIIHVEFLLLYKEELSIQ
jgi:hypothetical protein